MEKGQGRRSVFGIGVPNKPELSGAAVRFSYNFGICHLAFAGKMFAKGSVTEFGGEILDDQSRHVVVVSCVQRCVWWEGVVVMSRERASSSESVNQ